MKKESLLMILLTGSVILNLILWWKPAGTTCYVTPGYEVPEEITNEAAKGFTEEFRMSLKDPDTTLGAVISRSAFDAMMCEKDCNAISISYGRDSLGETGPGGNGTFVILRGAHVDYDEKSKTISRCSAVGAGVYVTRNWCPPSCIPF